MSSGTGCSGVAGSVGLDIVGRVSVGRADGVSLAEGLLLLSSDDWNSLDSSKFRDQVEDLQVQLDHGLQKRQHVLEDDENDELAEQK